MKTHDPMTNKTKGPIPLPAGEVPEGLRCVSLCIPDSNEYYRILVGAIFELTHWNNYERDSTHKATLVAQAWRKALLAGMLQCNQFRNNGGRLEFSGDGGDTWTPVNTTAPGSSSYDPRTGGTKQPARTGDNKACLAARNAAECIHQLHVKMVEWYDTYSTALAIAQFIEAVLILFLPLDWPIGLAILSYTLLTSSMLALSDALNTGSWDTTVTDTLTCILFCNADFNGQWNQAEFDAIRAELQAKNAHIYDLIDLWLDQVIGPVGLCNAGTTNSIATYDCGGCECAWCYSFYDGTGLENFVPIFGVYTNQAWHRVYENNTYKLYIELEVPAGEHLTGVTVNGSWWDALTQAEIVLFTGPNHTGDRTDIYLPNGTNESITFDRTDVRTIRFASNANQDSRDQFINDMRVTGMGTCPFGTPNC